MKYAWIEGHKKHWPVSFACEVLGVSTSGFFENMRRKGAEQPSKPGANKRISNEALLAHIRDTHVEVKQEYGWPKMWNELVARGIRVGKERVRRMMQEHGIKARGKRQEKVCGHHRQQTQAARCCGPAPAQLHGCSPQSVWTGDITYIATDEGWLYLAAVVDLFSRQVVGWSMQAHIQSSGVRQTKARWVARVIVGIMRPRRVSGGA